MDTNKIAAQITGFLTWMVTNPLGFLLWVIGSIAILAVASTMLAPIFPQVFRPYGDLTRWVYVAWFLYLMRGAGR